jgi:hypothetical protein
MAWKLDGTYFENCNCDWVCPCIVSSLTSPATYDRCHLILIYNVRAGEVDGLDVSGLSVAVVADTPAMMTDGNWRLGLIVDDAASQEQFDKLTAVFAGQMGGPMGTLAPFVGEVLGVEKAPIEYRDDGLSHYARIGGGIEIEVQDFVPPAREGQEPSRVTGIFHPSNSTLTIAKPTRTRISAFGMEFENAGRSAFSAPFSWNG